MEGGAPGTYRQVIKDAANGDADKVDPVVRRMLVAIANKADATEKKVDRIITLLVTTSISLGLLTASIVGTFIFDQF